MTTDREIIQAVRRGVGEVQRIYRRLRQDAEARATRRLQDATTSAERERVRKELELAKLVLQRRMYEAKAAVIREREAVRTARRSAGELTFGEQFMMGVRNVRGFVQGSSKPTRKRKTARRSSQKTERT